MNISDGKECVHLHLRILSSGEKLQPPTTFHNNK
jgi:hypothetical protein